MQGKFVPYEFALELKELGFDEECFAVYSEHDKTRVYDESFIKEGLKIQAPTWQDAFDWFETKYSLFLELLTVVKDSYLVAIVDMSKTTDRGVYNKRYEIDDINIPSKQEAYFIALEKLIELVKSK